MLYRKISGIIFVVAGIILLAAVFEATQAPLEYSLLYGFLAAVLIGVGGLCLIWDTSADKLKF